MTDPFATAICLGDDWRTVTDTLGSRLAGAAGRLGILYTAESFAPHLDEILTALRQHTGVQDWVSAAGYGVIAAGEEHFGESGAAALVLDLPPDGYRLFAGVRKPAPTSRRRNRIGSRRRGCRSPLRTSTLATRKRWGR